MKKIIKALFLIALGLSVISCGGGMNKVGEGVNKYFTNMINPGDKDIYEWKQQGFKNRAEISRWKKSGCRDPKVVRRLVNIGVTPDRLYKYRKYSKCDFLYWQSYITEFNKVVKNKNNLCKSYINKNTKVVSAEECFSEYFHEMYFEDERDYEKAIKWLSHYGHDKPYLPMSDIKHMKSLKENKKNQISFEDLVNNNFKKATSKEYKSIYRYCKKENGTFERLSDAHCQCRVATVYQYSDTDKYLWKDLVLLFTNNPRRIENDVSFNALALYVAFEKNCSDYAMKK